MGSDPLGRGQVMSFTCEFCKKAPVPEVNMICDVCAEKEIEAEDRDERYAKYYYERQRIRYDGIQTFDNEVGTISVTCHKKVLCTWNYGVFGHLLEPTRQKALLEAKGYVEGWCDAIAAAARMHRR